MAVLRTEFLAHANVLSESDKNRLTLWKNLQRVVSRFREGQPPPSSAEEASRDTSRSRMSVTPEVLNAIAPLTHAIALF